MSAKIDQCIADKSLVKVSAGEVCSIDTAKQLGIFDPNEYYKEGYEMLKTFQPTKDNRENRNAFGLCVYSEFKKKAFPYCPLVAGVNYVMKPGDPAKCIAVECPTDFQYDVEQERCVKPVIKKVVPLNSRNDERWYDWFMIPNYHLYNRYGSSNGVHLGPCPENYLPYFSKDPVDGVTVAANIADKDEQNIGRCISKDIYYGGKYAGTSDYCPISWIKRVGSTVQDLQANIQKVLEVAEGNGKKGEQTNEMKSLQNAVPQEAKRLMDELNEKLKQNKENLTNLLNTSEEMNLACAPMNTQQRLEDTYEICFRLRQDEEAFRQKLISVNGDSPALAGLKTKIAKYNCYKLFSGENSKAQTIDQNNIEFEDIEQIDLEGDLKAYEQEVKDREKVGDKITSDPAKQELVKTLTSKLLQWIKILVIIVVIIIFYFAMRVYFAKFVECILKPFLHWLTFKKLFKYNQCSLVDAKFAEEKVMVQSATRED